jgi:hypothetical protein
MWYFYYIERLWGAFLYIWRLSVYSHLNPIFDLRKLDYCILLEIICSYPFNPFIGDPKTRQALYIKFSSCSMSYWAGSSSYVQYGIPIQTIITPNLRSIILLNVALLCLPGLLCSLNLFCPLSPTLLLPSLQPSPLDSTSWLHTTLQSPLSPCRPVISVFRQPSGPWNGEHDVYIGNRTLSNYADGNRDEFAKYFMSLARVLFVDRFCPELNDDRDAVRHINPYGSTGHALRGTFLSWKRLQTMGIRRCRFSLLENWRVISEAKVRDIHIGFNFPQRWFCYPVNCG